MSGHVISELFQQIVHSEERIKQRFEALKKVNQGIQDHQGKIRNTKYEIEALQGNLSVLNHKVVQEEIELKWLRMRETILEEQKEKSFNQNAELRSEIAKLESEDAMERNNFLKDCDKFLKEFAFTGDNDMPNFEKGLKEELKKLQREYKQVTQEITALQIQDEKLKSLKIEKEDLSRDVEKVAMMNEALMADLHRFEKEREELKAVKDGVAKKSLVKSELQRMLSDLEVSKRECTMLSQDHQTLATELYQLQQTFMQTEHRHKQTGNPWRISKQKRTSSEVASKSADEVGSSKKVATSGRKLFNYKAHRRSREQMIGDSSKSFVDESEPLTESQPEDAFDFDLDNEDASFMNFAEDQPL